MVEVRGLEPPASWSQTKRATNCATPRKHCAHNHTLKRWQFQYLTSILAFQVLALACKAYSKLLTYGANAPYTIQRILISIIVLHLSISRKQSQNTPAVTAEPITPAMLGPMACIRRKLAGLAFCPSTWDTRAAMGTAEHRGTNQWVILPPEISTRFPNSNPPTVAKENAIRPRPMIIIVSSLRKVSALPWHR